MRTQLAAFGLLACACAAAQVRFRSAVRALALVSLRLSLTPLPQHTHARALLDIVALSYQDQKATIRTVGGSVTIDVPPAQ